MTASVRLSTDEGQLAGLGSDGGLLVTAVGVGGGTASAESGLGEFADTLVNLATLTPGSTYVASAGGGILYPNRTINVVNLSVTNQVDVLLNVGQPVSIEGTSLAGPTAATGLVEATLDVGLSGGGLVGTPTVTTAEAHGSLYAPYVGAAKLGKASANLASSIAFTIDPAGTVVVTVATVASATLWSGDTAAGTSRFKIGRRAYAWLAAGR